MQYGCVLHRDTVFIAVKLGFSYQAIAANEEYTCACFVVVNVAVLDSYVHSIEHVTTHLLAVHPIVRIGVYDAIIDEGIGVLDNNYAISATLLRPERAMNDGITNDWVNRYGCTRSVNSTVSYEQIAPTIIMDNATLDQLSIRYRACGVLDYRAMLPAYRSSLFCMTPIGSYTTTLLIAFSIIA